MHRATWREYAASATGGGIVALIAHALGLIPDGPALLRLAVVFAFGLAGGMIVPLLNDLRLRRRAERLAREQPVDPPAAPQERPGR